MKKVYGYIRVSTVKQGTGVSLQEQKEAIIRYADKHNLEIIEWFEEQETAAKQGRPLFNKMMKLVKAGKSNGVIIHKIDRSARNLKDWALLGDLIDQGYEIHFAHESLDMDTRGGRLAADIQAVIASDYIRNLRDEAIKGLYGRLKQGIYPFGAPIGYINQGRGQLKTIDAIQGPLVKKAFQLYSTGNYHLRQLTKVMDEYGLRNLNGNSVCVNSLSLVLNNPFYVGIIKVKGKTFQGNHQPLISSSLFFKVQSILRGKTNTKIIKHHFQFRRLLKCNLCDYSLIGEKVKGHIYYRCHSKECPTKTVREDRLEKLIINSFEPVRLPPIEYNVLNEFLEDAKVNWLDTQQGIKESIQLQKGVLLKKQDRLTDAFIDGLLDKQTFDSKKEQLLIELNGLNTKSNELSDQKELIFRKAKNFLEHLKSLKNSYLNSNPEEKSKILKFVTSNLTIDRKKLIVTMKSPFYEISNLLNSAHCWELQDRPLNCTAENDKPETNTVAPVDNPALRERMKELLEIILKHFELVEDEEVLDMQEND